MASPARRALAPLLVVAALGAATLAAGCGSSTKAEEPGSAAVRAALLRLDRVQAAGDGRTACHGLIAVEERGRIEIPGAEPARGADAEAGAAAEEADAEAGSSACERAFARATASRRTLRHVTLDVRAVQVKGDRATAAVHTEVTRADGSSLRQDATRRLVRRDGRWRVLLTAE